MSSPRHTRTRSYGIVRNPFCQDVSPINAFPVRDMTSSMDRRRKTTSTLPMLEPPVVPERRVSDPVKSSASRRQANLASDTEQRAAYVPTSECQEEPITDEQSNKRPIKRKNARVEQGHLPSIVRPTRASQDKQVSVYQKPSTLPVEMVQKQESSIRIIDAADNQVIQDEERKILKQLTKVPKQGATISNQEVAMPRQEVHTKMQWTEMLDKEHEKNEVQETNEQEQKRRYLKQEAWAGNQESMSPELISSTHTPRPSVLTEFSSTDEGETSWAKEKVVLINQRTVYRPKYCWCLRCQIMFSLYKTGDRALEMWGNYPCFRR